MRRKAGSLLDLEARLLTTFVRLDGGHGQPHAELHGFALAKLLADEDGSKRLTGHGTLYKALGRLEDGGLVTSRWEDATSEAPGRPRRRLYRITTDGRAAAASHESTPAALPPTARSGVALP